MRLSERYGIDPARLDSMLGKPKETAPAIESAPAQPADPTREWIEERRFAQDSNVAAPVAAVPAPAVPVAATATPVQAVPTISPAQPASNVSIPKDVRSSGTPLSDRPSSVRYEKTYDTNRSSPLTWILGAAVIGLLIYFLALRGCNKETAQQEQQPAPVTPAVVDSTPTQDSTVAVDSATASAVPPVAATTPSTPPRRATRPRTRTTTSAASTRNVALSTTSSFAAQEKLAELKADGNTKAYIQPVKRNGVTLYQVKTRR